MIRRFLFILLALALSACTMSTSQNGELSEAEPTPSNALSTRSDLETVLGDLRAAQTTALAFWDRIIFGEVVSCQDYFSVPPLVQLDPATLAQHADASAIQDKLNEAVLALQASAAYWDSECATDRPDVPLEVAEQGRANALSAGPALDAAAQLLAGWPQ